MAKDKFIVKPSPSGDGMKIMGVRMADFEMFKEMAEMANVKNVDLFHEMVLFCSIRLTVEEE